MTVKVSGSSGLIFLDGILQSYGDSNDLQINHDGSNSYINDAGTGNLRLQTGGSTKLEVTSSGIDVTGTVTADGLKAEGSSAGGTYLTSSSGSLGGDIRIEHIINSGRNLNTINSVSGLAGHIPLAFSTSGNRS